MIDDIHISPASDDPERELALRLLRKLTATNVKRGMPDDIEPFALSACGSGGDLIGGIAGYTKWQWMFVEALWVAEEMRGLGLGDKLLSKAEALARARNCIGVWLDTMSFEAKPFYVDHGYEEFGKIDNFPPGYQRHFLLKKLT